MEVDIILEPDLGPSQLVELAQAAERYGIRAIWTSNYFAHWDAFISLVPVAQATKKLRMGALAVSPFEMHPLKIANSLLSLNELSGGGRWPPSVPAKATSMRWPCTSPTRSSSQCARPSRS